MSKISDRALAPAPPRAHQCAAVVALGGQGKAHPITGRRRIRLRAQARRPEAIPRSSAPERHAPQPPELLAAGLR